MIEDKTGYDTDEPGGEFNNKCAWCAVTITNYGDIATGYCQACRFHRRDNETNTENQPQR